ncbi:S-layer homology domain-containing protein [Paenibacillus thalictri]|uniref:SLH domain-containing protein n=1 Tax=Paenibacillus thalictri TaxID=2527873 RepID=A0A4Q9DHI7_9BACL|nr:S-layer homology domain-containing protein [Paenibacillus thalictri]TBL71396.1 hypothetical protein EYB31_30365 [Paenibacillus thalictri]
MNRKLTLATLLTTCVALTATSFPALAATSTGVLNVDSTVTSIFDPVKDNGDAGDHTHGSSIVELPNGELLSVWFQGNGERDATTTRIMGARSLDQGKTWKTPFVVTDAQQIADINPVVYVDSGDRLWLFWYPVLAGRWNTSQPMYAYAEKGNYEFEQVGNKKPNWDFSEIINIKIGMNTGSVVDPSNTVDYISQERPELKKGFVNTFKAKLADQKDYVFKPIDQGGAGVSQRIWGGEFDSLVTEVMQLIGGDPTKYKYAPTVADSIWQPRSGYPLARRLGWQTKDKPFAVNLGNGKVRLLLPLYSDTLETSIMAFTEYDPSKRLADNSIRWEVSEPLVGVANVQPTMAQRKDGTIVAYMRDNGKRPYRVISSESRDGGLTWTIAKDVPELQDPGVGHDLLQLKNGNWVFAHVDTESGRNTLAVALSDDEGKTWKYRRHLVVDTRANVGNYHYPAVSEAKNGDILISFSRFYSSDDKNAANQSLASYKHIVFSRVTEDWIKQGDANTVIREYASNDYEIAVPASFNINTASDDAIKSLFPSTVKGYYTFGKGAVNAVLPSVDLPVNWDISKIKANFILNKYSDKNITGTVNTDKLPSGVTNAMLPAFDPQLRVYLYNDPAAVPATKVTLDQSSLNLFAGGTATLKATVAPDNASNKTVFWTSSNPKVATVDTNGVVKAVAVGSASITAQTLDGGFTAKTDVQVNFYSSGGSSGGSPSGGTSSGPSGTGTTGTTTDNGTGTTGSQGNSGTSGTTSGQTAFKDITGYSWAQAAIEALASKGIVNGTGDQVFSPEKNISRADILTMLVRALDLKATFDSNFSDTQQGDYYYESLGIAKALGITNGVDGTSFNPTAEISRQDLMVLAARALKVTGKLTESGTKDDLSAFKDVSNIADYAVDSIAALVKAGIIEGSDNMINPQGKATRAEVAVIVFRILDKLK